MSFRPEFRIEVGGGKVTIGARTLVMGVLNVTPDSFSDGGRYFDPARAIQHGVDLARQGADWIDVGGESTRPGARSVTAEEELPARAARHPGPEAAAAAGPDLH